MNLPYEIYRTAGSPQKVLAINAGLLSTRHSPTFQLKTELTGFRLEINSNDSVFNLIDLPEDIPEALVAGQAQLVEFNSFGVKAAHDVLLKEIQ